MSVTIKEQGEAFGRGLSIYAADIIDRALFSIVLDALKASMYIDLLLYMASQRIKDEGERIE